MKKLFTLVCLLLFAIPLIFGQDEYCQNFGIGDTHDPKSICLNFSNATDNPCFQPFAAFSEGEMSQNQLDNLLSTTNNWFVTTYGTNNMVTLEFEINHYWPSFGNPPSSYISTQAEIEWNQVTMPITLTVTDNPPDPVILGGEGTKIYTATFPVETMEPTLFGNNIYGELLKLTFYKTGVAIPTIAFETATMVLATGNYLENNSAWTTQALSLIHI